MPELQRSVAVFEPDLERTETIRPQRKASISELEQMVKEFRKEKDYSSAVHVMDTVDGLKRWSDNFHDNYKINQMELEEARIEEEKAAMEKHENMRKIRRGVPTPMFRPIEPENIEHELKYIRTYGIEKFIDNYTHRSYEGITCLRDARYLNAQLSFLELHA